MKMEINSEFIDELVGSFHDELLLDGDWCRAADFDPTNNFYKKKIYQKIYALRYLPAYYFEYCVLANELYKRIDDEYISLNVASFGCGLAPDYYALRDNLGDIHFNYLGYDSVEWSTQALMPTTHDNFKFVFKSIRNIEDDELNGIDVYIFPKSIGDIESSGVGVIDKLATLIASSPQKRLFFLNSFVSNDNKISQHLNIFKKIDKALLSAGFKTDDDINKTYHRGNSYGMALTTINSNFVYPNERFIECEYEGNKFDCQNCNVIKRPILTNKYMDYQILEYNR
jgi:hypothetical protein